MRTRFLVLVLGVACFTGVVACHDMPSAPPDADASAFCGASNISGPAEPSSPQFSCATGTSTEPEQVDWGILNGTLCFTTGIPPAGLNGFQCTDPSTMTVVISEKGRQHFVAYLVNGSLTAPGRQDPFGPCTPTDAGTIRVEPTNVSANDSATFTITQETADFVYGRNVQAPPICSVGIVDGHDQHVLVNIGVQVAVVCTNASCTG
ncbi:MAG TPA: hypothetical protein VFA43_00070 [Gemmatimonadaceae bacterium]|nr:hypothetical protein [Gemmatimonadaceae bacterium]